MVCKLLSLFGVSLSLLFYMPRHFHAPGHLFGTVEISLKTPKLNNGHDFTFDRAIL